LAKKEYDWRIGDEPPKIGIHSLAKHRVYEEYVTHYIQVLNTNPRIPEFRLTLIDGFAGGGVYRDPLNNSHYPGSPLRLIKATEAATAAVNVKRQQESIRAPFTLQAEYFFIEKKKSNYEYLSRYLSEQGLGTRFEKDIFLLCSEFSPLMELSNALGSPVKIDAVSSSWINMDTAKSHSTISVPFFFSSPTRKSS